MRGAVDGVVEQRGAPQEGLLAEQHTVQAGQALLGGVRWPQPILQPALGAVPRLPRVVHAPQVVGTCGVGEEEAALGRTSKGPSCPAWVLVCPAGPLASDSHILMPLNSGSYTSPLHPKLILTQPQAA